MQFLVYRGAITIPMTGVQELQAQRISASIAQQLQIEGAKIGLQGSKGFTLTGGLFSGALKNSPIFPVGSGAIDISAEDGKFVIRYKLCFDQWLLYLCCIGILIVAIIYSENGLPLIGALLCIAVPMICFFGVQAAVAIARIKKTISSCLRDV